MVKDFYEVEEFARLVGKAAFTVREWARLGRIHAIKRKWVDSRKVLGSDRLSLF
jgi:predicted site-specific integrase-resolvase